MKKNEDIETMLASPRVEDSIILAILSKLYPLDLIMNSTITIIVCSIVMDQAISHFAFQDKPEKLFSALPALDYEN